MQTEEGRGIVEDYYEIAPGIVMMIDMRKDARSCLQQPISAIFGAVY